MLMHHGRSVDGSLCELEAEPEARVTIDLGEPFSASARWDGNALEHMPVTRYVSSSNLCNTRTIML